MSQPPINPETPKQLSTNDLAADRTLMAWIRTCLSLIGFGFGIPTIVRAIENTRISHSE